MQTNKTALIILALLMMSCTLFMQERDGWHYIYTGDIVSAHKEFLRDYAYAPDSVKHSAGLAYTYFLMDQPDSARVYIDVSSALSSTSGYTLFACLQYARFNDAVMADTVYDDYIDRFGYDRTGFIIDSVISNAYMHKMGLISKYEKGDYDFVYDALKQLTSIPDTLDVQSVQDRAIMLDYIEKLEE